MNEENTNMENNENQENVNEEVNNAAEENAEVSEPVSLDKTDETADVAETVETSNTAVQSEANSNNKNILIAVIAVIVVIILAIGGYFLNKNGFFETNKYNKMGYINISGSTLDDVAAAAGMTTDEFKTEYQLPEDMPGSTYESAAFYNMPTSKIAEMYGMSFEDVITLLDLPDTVTETTPWGEAEGEASLKNYVGETAVEDFKKEYNLGDDITGDTKWKDVRNIVDQVALDKRLEEEKKAADATPAAEGQELSEEELQAIIESMQQQADNADAANPSEAQGNAPAATAAN